MNPTHVCKQQQLSWGINRFSSPEQEINSISRGGSQSSTTSTSLSNMNHSQTNVALNFNSRQNYGLSSQPQRKCPVVRQQQIQATTKQNSGQTSDIHTKYIKDVYLLPDPTWEMVPRRKPSCKCTILWWTHLKLINNGTWKI